MNKEGQIAIHTHLFLLYAPIIIYTSEFMTDQELRFGGIARLYGEKTLQRFLTSHIMIIGIGGVGTWVAEALARSGIGELSLIDLDDICITNTNRQIHALQSTIGQSKVKAMAQRLQDINPDYHNAHNRRLCTP